MVANEAEGRAEASRRIAACRTAQSEELDLGGLRLTALDGELLAALCQLGWLRRLFLGPSAEARGNGEKNPGVSNALGALPGALFDALTRLERLDLSLNRLRGLPISIANLTALISLDLWGNEIGNEGARALKGLVNLTSLDLGRNEIGDEGAQALKGLTKLTNLGLADNKIGNEGTRALKGLINLTSLDLGRNEIGDEGARTLKGLIKAVPGHMEA
jgi:Leucine-rich repeat (LRR) protein